MAGLAAVGAALFNVVVVQVNGEVQRQKEVSTLDVSLAGVALLGADGSIRCRTGYTPSMQVTPDAGPSHFLPAFLFLLTDIPQVLTAAKGTYRNYCVAP